MEQLLLWVLVIVIAAVIGGAIALVCEWNDDRLAAVQRAKEAEKRRIATNAFAVKQQLDAEAYAARKALFQAAQRHSGGSGSK
ncbi:hypothetical protein [Subtercola lobariae]|uniref:Uncharacterized protein n=1 Tax=Subtercola lobariae TaxID=1588641 RepID=A0A917B2H0_9MICO|nr:hypothetical protein [Subtercola lobariae]GGF18543.1 hypothetical protein GCM10011399_10240 [Subtercola lobariae]